MYNEPAVLAICIMNILGSLNAFPFFEIRFSVNYQRTEYTKLKKIAGSMQRGMDSIFL